MAKGFGNRLKEQREQQTQSTETVLTLNTEDNNSSIITTARKGNRLIELPPERFKPDPNQPRQKFTETEIRKLMWDMELNSQLQAILVREADEDGIYPILVGECRWRAVGMSEGRIPTVLAIKIDPNMALDDLKVLMMQLSENNKRTPITVIEEAYAYQRVVEVCKQKNETQKFAADLLGVSPSQLTKYLSLISAPAEVMSLATEGKTQDVETLYNLVQVSKTNPETVQDFVDNVQKGKIESDGLRQVTKKILATAKGKDDLPPKEQVEVKRKGESKTNTIKNVFVADDVQLHFPKNSNDVELVIQSGNKEVLVVLSEDQLNKLKKQIKG